MKIIDNAGYKDLSGIRRIPIARVVGKGGVESVVIGNDAIDQAGARIKGKPYMNDAMMGRLFDGSPLVVEEKVDGHPVIILHGGYTFFCEQLTIQHSVSYEQVPYSLDGWPDMTVVYDVLDGEFEPPYRVGTGSRMPWLSRSEKETVCEMVGAPVVPLVWQGKVSPEGLPVLADRISSFSGASKAEGIVLKNYRTGVFGKFINLEFQQRITDEALQGGVHPMQRAVKNIRRYASASRVADRYLSAAPLPLSEREERDLRKVAPWAMEFEADGGVVPPDIEVLLHTDRWKRLTLIEARKLLRWYYGTAPGYF